MHQPQAARHCNGGAVDNLRQTLSALLKSNYEAEAVLQMMLAEAVRLFPGLTLTDHRSIVSCVIEDAVVADRDALSAANQKDRCETFGKIIPFPARRALAKSKR